MTTILYYYRIILFIRCTGIKYIPPRVRLQLSNVSKFDFTIVLLYTSSIHQWGLEISGSPTMLIQRLTGFTLTSFEFIYSLSDTYTNNGDKN